MKFNWKKSFLTAATLLSAVVLGACGDGEASTGDAGYVGIAMPTKSAERWIADGNNMVTELEKLGYKTDLQYGEDKVENQVAQIENMITKGVDVFVRKVAPLGDPIEVTVRGYELSLRKADAEMIEVE